MMFMDLSSTATPLWEFTRVAWMNVWWHQVAKLPDLTFEFASRLPIAICITTQA